MGLDDAPIYSNRSIFLFDLENYNISTPIIGSINIPQQRPFQYYQKVAFISIYMIVKAIGVLFLWMMMFI